MPETGKLARTLAALVPPRVRLEVWDPARRELRLQALEETSRPSGPPALHGARRRLRLILLFFDCYRTWILAAARPDPGGATLGDRRGMLLSDLRHAFRRLRREPSFTLPAGLTLALGVGANVAVFAVVEAVLLRPLPYEDAEALVIVNHRDIPTGVTKEFIAIGDYVDLEQRQRGLEQLSAYGTSQVTVRGDVDAYRVSALVGSEGLLDVLRARPEHGRLFEAGDHLEGAAPVAILGHGLWQERFGGDPSAVGRSITVGSTPHMIVGVASPSFRFPPDGRTDLIVPMTLPLDPPVQRKSGWVFAVGRLGEGRTLEAVTTELAALSRTMEAEHPEQNTGSTYYAASLRDQLVGDTRQVLLLLLASVGFVLLIACANVANLQLTRALGRKRETALRLVLGGGRRRVARLYLAESLVLCVAAGAAGVAIAWAGSRSLIALVPTAAAVPGLDGVRLNGAVLAFALGLTAAAALVFGAFAAFLVQPGSEGDALGAGTRTTAGRAARRATAGLVAAEVSLAVVLLTAAGLVVRSFAGLISVDPGFDTSGVLVTEVQLPEGRYDGPEGRQAFWDRAFDEVRSVPGVTAVGTGIVVPLTGNNWTAPFERADRPVPEGERAPDVGWQRASGGWFQALDIPLHEGRLFDERDGPGAPPVVIVSEALARRFFPEESAVGRHVSLGNGTAEIVGVVGDIHRAGLTEAPREDLYFPFEPWQDGQTHVFVKTGGTIDVGTTAAVRAAFLRVDPGIAVLSMRTMDDVASESVAVTRLLLWLLSAFSACALALAAVGIYGVMAYAVRQRRREIGTRMAVGATRLDIQRLVLMDGVKVAAIGVAAGLALGVFAVRPLGTVLFQMSPFDPAALLGAAGILGLTTLVASWLPAARATGVDPVGVLREE